MGVGCDKVGEGVGVRMRWGWWVVEEGWDGDEVGWEGWRVGKVRGWDGERG